MKSEATRLKILSVARPLFAQQGYKGVTVRDIAQLAQVNVSLISYYFGGKEALYREIIADYFNRAQQIFQDIEPVALKAREGKTQYFQFWKYFFGRLIEFKTQNSEIEEIMLMEYLQGLPYSYEIQEQSLPKLLKRLQGLFDYGKQKKWVRTDIDSFLFFTHMIQAVDLFLVMSRGKCPFHKQAQKILKSKDYYINQLFLIYFEGAKL